LGGDVGLEGGEGWSGLEKLARRGWGLIVVDLLLFFLGDG
jgi:hypothetical protein